MRSLKFRAGAVVLALAFTFNTVACSTSWVKEALSIIAALTPAITNIVPLVSLADSNIGAQDITTIQKYSDMASQNLQLVGSLIDQYNTAQGTAAQQDVLTKIQAALEVAQNNLNSILPALHISNAKSQLAVQSAVGAAISEVGSIAALLPILKAGRTADAVALAQPLSASKFRARYNAAISPIPGASKLELRGPSFAHRLVSVF